MIVLLVEDDAFFQKFYAAKIKDSGFEVDIANNGVEALEKLKSLKPDLILLDLIMPEKDGFEVLQALSASPSYKDIPVLVFSTLGQEEDVKKSERLGCERLRQ